MYGDLFQKIMDNLQMNFVFILFLTKHYSQFENKRSTQL